MKVMKAIAWTGIVIGLIGIAGTYAAEGQYGAKASLHQLVKESPEAGLFGDPYEKIGTPQVFVIEDPAAVLPDKTEDGTPMLSKDKLDAKGLYPLQMVMVTWAARLFRIGFGGLLVVAGIILAWVELRARKKAATAAPA